ncbi:MAG: VOC family protein [Parvularculaceae bacterium]
MAKVTGIGGVFFKARDPKALMKWYADHLGVVPDEGYFGASFKWREAENDKIVGRTVLGLFNTDTEYFNPSEKPFMINLRVDDLDGMLARLRAAGCAVEDKVEDYDYGRFGWVTDPEGVKIELWEPKGEGEEGD